MLRKTNRPSSSSLSLLSSPLLVVPMLSLVLITLLTHLSLNPSPASSDPAVPIQIQQACRSSLYPSLCLSSIPLSRPASLSPTDLIQSAVSLSIRDLGTAQSLSRSILDASGSDPDRENAARDCLEHLSLSSRRLSAVAAGGGMSAEDRRAYAGAALLYQYDCWSALRYVNGTHQVASAMAFVSNLTRLTSNALAMAAALQRFGDDMALWAPPQTERDGYWPAGPAGGDGGGEEALSFPADLKADVTVCKAPGGGCDYATVQEAVDAAPDYGPRRFVISIAAGVYEETVRVPFEKTNVAFLGDGAGRTVITGKLNAQMPGVTTYDTATVAVAGDGFMARGLTFANAAGPGSHQAVAFRSDSDRSFLHSVEFSGHQDTLYARSLRQLYHSCTVSGTVDFIFGNSAAVFYNTSLLVLTRQEGAEKGESNAVTAHGRTDPGQATGFVFRKCTVNGSEEYVEVFRRRPGRHKVYLGRPWKEYSRTVWVESYMEEVVRAEGWMPWRGEFALKTLFYGEYGNEGPGAAVEGRVEWSSRIPAERVGVYSVSNFIQGDRWTSTHLKS